MSEKEKRKETGSSGQDGEKSYNQAEMREMMSTFYAMMQSGNGSNGHYEEEELKLRGKLNQRLTDLPPVTVAFPPCTDVLLSLIRSDKPADEINAYFNEYFRFCDHTILADQSLLDPALLSCENKWVQGVNPSPCDPVVLINNPSASSSTGGPAGWPPPWCLPRSCTTLLGDRHLYKNADPLPTAKLRRLFVGDLVWLFFMERMGVFQIIGRIMDEYAYGGKIPISNGVVIPGPQDDMISLVLEAMVRQTETGTSTKMRDRTGAYRAVLGWTTEAGKKLELRSVVNHGFNNLFNRFIYNALDFYKDKRLAVLIKDTATAARPSASTLVAIRDTLNLLGKAFDNFDYGRNYYNTLSGIVWAIAAMSVIRDLRTTLGIPPEFEQPYEYIPAAYDLLVLNRSITPSESNRYQLHRECANAARDILLDVEVLNIDDTHVGGELDLWLHTIEDRVESYRAAYRSLTGVDLAETRLPVLEQQA